MHERRRIEERVKRKEQEIQALESQIKDARVYIQALQDVLKLLPRDNDGEPDQGSTLRPGSLVAQARTAIKTRGVAMHVDEILHVLGKEANRQNKTALSGSLAAYVRRGEIFTRPAPNTFGLVEFEPLLRVPLRSGGEPPPNFGEDDPS